MNMPDPKKIILMMVIAAAIILFFVFDLQQYLNLEYLKQSRERFRELNAENMVIVLGGYFPWP